MEPQAKLLDLHSIPLPTKLASMLVEVFENRKEYRLKGYAGNCAAMVQQIHYYITQEFGSIPKLVKQKLEDGKRWIFKSYSSWQETLPWLSDYAFRKVRSLLVELGLIEVKQLGLRQSGRDRTCWYTLNYEHPFLQQLLRADVEQGGSTDTQVSNSTNASVPSSTTASVECQPIPITTSNTTGNTLSGDETQSKTEEAETTVNLSVGSKVESKILRPKSKISDECKSSAATAAESVEPWEVAPQPYPYFLQWRALHYKNQGGHWANSPQSNAYAEFYKNRFKTNIFWQEFLQFYNLALDSALALQAAGIEVKLPECLSDRAVVNEEAIAVKAEALENKLTQSKPQIAPDCDFRAKMSQLVRHRTLAKSQPEKQQPSDSVQMYLEWLHGDEPVLVEEARKKLTRLVMERDDLEADWDESGKLINVAFLG